MTLSSMIDRETYILASLMRLPPHVRREIMDRLALEVLDAQRKLEGHMERDVTQALYAQSPTR